MNKAYDVITNKIIEQLENGVIPWHRPWSGGELPKNMVSDKEYRGINVFMLSFSGFSSPYWVTYNQAKAKGGHVKKGEKGFPVIFYSMKKRENAIGEMESFPLMRYYTVFNVCQCDGIEVPEIPEKPFNPIKQCERVSSGYIGAPPVKHDEQRAYYNPRLDIVNMPKRETFEKETAYYSVLFHELAHSTGHENRLKRQGIADLSKYGDTVYSKEELIAEMSAAYLCGHCGIDPETIQDSAAYIASWLKRIKDDRKILIQSASSAQKAADYILNNERG